MDLIEAIYPMAEKHGYDVVLGAQTPTRAMTKAVEELLGFRTAAVLLLGDATLAEVTRLAARVPLVAVGPHLRGDAFDTVSSDDSRGARLAVEHLVELGHRHIVHVDGGVKAGAADRRRGYRTVMRKHGLPATIIPGAYTEESGALAARELLRCDPLPTAVFAGNDRCAVGIVHALRRFGLTCQSLHSSQPVDDLVVLVGQPNVSARIGNEFYNKVTAHGHGGTAARTCRCSGSARAVSADA